MHVACMHGCIFICVRGHARMRARIRARTQTRKPPAVRRTHVHARRRSHARTLACAIQPNDVVPYTCARTGTRTNKHTLARWQPVAHAHVHPHTRTHAHARTGARADMHAHEHRRTHTGRARRRARAARARSAAGRRRSVGPLYPGTRTLRRRCSRTAPTCTRRRTISGAWAGRCLGHRDR